MHRARFSAVLLQSFVAMLGIAAVQFAWTNVDDLFVLIGFFSDPRVRARSVVVGQYVGIGLLYGVSVLVSLLSIVVSQAYVGLLGLAPILIGVTKLYSTWRGVATDNERWNQQVTGLAPAGRNVLTVALTTVANGGDNVSVYAPLFATRSALDVVATGFVFALMTALWWLLGCIGLVPAALSTGIGSQVQRPLDSRRSWHVARTDHAARGRACVAVGISAQGSCSDPACGE